MVALFLVLGLVGSEPKGAGMEANDSVRLVVVYDNRSLKEELKPDWGFGCVVNAAGHRMLFDTGAKSDILLANMQRLGIDPGTVEVVAISHNHWDHTGGLDKLLPNCAARRPADSESVPCYIPASAASELSRRISQAGGRSVPVDDSVGVWPGVWLTGELGTDIMEQALVVGTKPGLVLITGCAHPGVVTIARHVKKVFGTAPYLVLGGFHMANASAREVAATVKSLQDLGVKRVAPAHCTGDATIGRFKAAWPEGSESVGCGWVLALEAE